MDRNDGRSPSVAKQCNDFVNEFFKKHNLADGQKRYLLHGIDELVSLVQYVTGESKRLDEALRAFQDVRRVAPYFWRVGDIKSDRDESRFHRRNRNRGWVRSDLPCVGR